MWAGNKNTAGLPYKYARYSAFPSGEHFLLDCSGYEMAGGWRFECMREHWEILFGGLM